MTTIDSHQHGRLTRTAWPGCKPESRIIRSAAFGEAVIPRELVVELLMELCGNRHGSDALTGREAQVLGMLRRGHSTAAIAQRLEIALRPFSDVREHAPRRAVCGSGSCHFTPAGGCQKYPTTDQR